MSDIGNQSQPIVIAIGGFPPPVTGASKNLKLITNDIEQRAPHLIRCNIARGSVGSRLMLLPRRIWRYAKAWGTLIANARKENKTVYLTSDGGPGLLLTLLTVLIARASGFRIVLQHRTFQYVRERSHLASAINLALGSDGLHVFLSDGMAKRFFEQYAPSRAFRVNHNFAQLTEFSRAARRMPRKRDGRLRVGYLSNLMYEKGFHTFLEIAKASVAEGLDADFIIAGPAPSDKERTRVMTTVADLDGRLEWRGPVHDIEKLRFFRDIDIFVFPTRYNYEAQPNVVLEALCASAYVMASDLGCVREELDKMGGEIVPLEKVSCTDEWVERLRRISANGQDLKRRRAVSLRNTQAAITAASSSYVELIQIIDGMKASQSLDKSNQ